jgi:hypothetical protein
MRKIITTAGAVFLPAYGGALAWILAGIGWGVLTGCLDAAARTRGLLDATEGRPLSAAPALFAAVVGCLGMTCLHGLTLIPCSSSCGSSAAPSAGDRRGRGSCRPVSAARHWFP